jgi:hypothetical protein
MIKQVMEPPIRVVGRAKTRELAHRPETLAMHVSVNPRVYGNSPGKLMSRKSPDLPDGAACRAVQWADRTALQSASRSFHTDRASMTRNRPALSDLLACISPATRACEGSRVKVPRSSIGIQFARHHLIKHSVEVLSFRSRLQHLSAELLPHHVN